jgi:hypothetical protein
VVVDGGVYIGVRALAPSCLADDAPIVLERGPEDELWLTIYNYRGPPKFFWEYASLGGAFWNGNIRAGYIVEIAERYEYPSAAAFLAHLVRAEIDDTVDDAKVRTVRFRSGGDELELRYDLMRSVPGDRRINGSIYEPPPLSSPLAVQGESGRLAVGRANLETSPRMAWLIAQELDPDNCFWVAAFPGDRPAPVRFETPLGVVSSSGMGMGHLELRTRAGGNAELTVDSLREPDDLRVPSGVTIRRVAP